MTVSQNTVGILTDRLGRTACTECGVELDVSEYSVFERIICPACEEEQVVPAKLGDFLLQDLLGTGGMGAVYLAQDQTLRRQVALKVMRAQFGSDSKHYESFRTEAQATARLNHPNIVQVYSLGDEKGQPYIVMELLDGDRLEDLMESVTPISNLKILEVARDVSKGLDAASKAGVIHGDIKPGNILFDKRNVAKVVDFGLAKFMEAGGDKEGNTEIWGTPFYIAPEKARKKGEDARSDQYSLGTTLWHCLANEAPFDGETPADVVLARFKIAPPSICEKREDITEKTDHILQRMMARKPAERYPTYSSLLADIEEALEEVREIEHKPVYEASKTPSWVKPALTYGGGILLVGILASVFAPKEDEAVTQANDSHVSRNTASATLRAEAPFSDLEEDFIVQSAANYLQGRAFNADSQLIKAQQAYPGATLQMHWSELFRAVNALLDGDALATGSLLRPLIIQSKPYSQFPALREDPRDMAKMLTGKLTPKQFFETHAGSAAWYQEYGHFIAGLVNARQGKPDEVTRHVDQLAVSTASEPKWIYAFKPYAAKVSAETVEYKNFSAQRRTSRGTETWAASHLGLWAKALKNMSPRKPSVVRQPTPKPVVKKPVVHKPAPVAPVKLTVNAQDRKKVEDFTAMLLSQLVTVNFNQILEAKMATPPSLSSAAGRSMLNDHLEVFKAALDLRNFLEQNVKKLKYGGSALESGIPIHAKFTALLFEKRGKRTAIQIKDIPPLDLLRVFSWYLNNTRGVSDMDKKLLGLSLYAKHYKAPQYAEQVWNSVGSTYKKAHPYTYLLFE